MIPCCSNENPGVLAEQICINLFANLSLRVHSQLLLSSEHKHAVSLSLRNLLTGHFVPSNGATEEH